VSRNECNRRGEMSSSEERCAERDDSEIIEGLQEENEMLRRELESLREAEARARADYQNLQKRNARRLASVREEIRGEIVCEFLTVIDDLRMVLASTRDRGNDPIRQGVEMILGRIESILSNMGITQITCEGEAFDPNLHEAIDYVPTENAADGTVIEEVLTGYCMEDRLLRPARVRVARGYSEEAARGCQCNDDTREER